MLRRGGRPCAYNRCALRSGPFILAERKLASKGGRGDFGSHFQGPCLV